MKKRPRKDAPPASGLDKLALWITEHVGSMGFFMAIFVWTAAWLLWNMFAPRPLRFDPFPGFVLWLFISNMIQLFLMPLIMVGQNLQSKVADERAESDFEINRNAEAEIREIKARLDAIIKHLDIEPGRKGPATKDASAAKPAGAKT